MKPSSSKKIVASMVLIVASIAYVIYLNVGDSQEFSATNPRKTTNLTQTSASRKTAPATATAPTPTTATIPATTPAPTPKAKPSGLYADGTYTGNTADAYYGTVQVRALISGGKLTDVIFLQYPNDRSTSREISAQAMPILTSEAIQSQSANVDIVSGASDTSAAFQQSLGSALAQAKN